MAINKKIVVLGLFLLTQGCGDWNLFPASLEGIEERYAVGSRDEMQAVLVLGEARVVSSDPSVVEIVPIDENRFELRAVGIGHAKVEIEDDEGHQTYKIEVASPDPALTRVELIETSPWAVVPVISMAGQTILAERDQHFAVRYADENGSLHGSGLATVTLPEGASECEKGQSTSLDLFCARFATAGEQSLTVSLGDDTYFVTMNTVLESEVIGLEVIADDEATLHKGDTGRIDLVGLTETGAHVFGIGASFETTDDVSMGYFVYNYSPKAEPLTLTARALGFEEVVSFRGEHVPTENAHDCSTAPWTIGAVSPLAAVALIMLGAIRIRRERLAVRAR